MLENSINFNIQISLEPVKNMLFSLFLIEKSNDLSGLNHWPIDVYNSLSKSEREIHRILFQGFYYAIMPEKSMTSFPGYLNYLNNRKPEAIVYQLLDQYMDRPAELKDELKVYLTKDNDIDVDMILASEYSYIKFLKQLTGSDHNDPFCCIDEELEKEAYKLLKNPVELQKILLDHMTMLWDRYLAAEWISVKSIAIDSVNSYNQISFPEEDIHDVIQRITDKDSRTIFKEHTLKRMEQIDRFVFVPSPHLGPYINKLIQGGSMWIFFGAKLPAGSKFDAPALDHQEIVTKLTALADTKRLAVLKHISTVGERSSTQIINDLNLSQSAASRHLKQLSATGLLIENRKKDGKYYQINKEKICSIFKSVTNYLIPDS